MKDLGCASILLSNALISDDSAEENDPVNIEMCHEEEVITSLATNTLNENITTYQASFKESIGNDVKEHDLSVRHGVHQSTTSRIINYWLNLMYDYMKQLPLRPSRKIINKYMPPLFKSKYPSTRVIIDATEVKIQTPSNCLLQSSTYSSYKCHNTLKDLYPGRISDKKLFCKSGLINKLECGNSVMADRGGKPQMNHHDEQTTRDIASVRIHVERAIGNI
ncbi:hypothetical protein FQR65_LT14582 [Abscondita terminalis]|nr:hypothetical protein FQR65_LT14582 [Abscondita terminalis]